MANTDTTTSSVENPFDLLTQEDCDFLEETFGDIDLDSYAEDRFEFVARVLFGMSPTLQKAIVQRAVDLAIESAADKLVQQLKQTLREQATQALQDRAS